MLGTTRVWLHFDDRDDPDLFDDWPHFLKGEGLIWSEGERYRVVDTWWSVDHHGRMDDGLHVFLERVTNPTDDRPRELHPDYFTA